MKLKISKRAGKQKSQLTKIRHEKDIPGVIYQRGKPSSEILVNGIEYRTILRTMKTGYLPTTVFKLDVDGKLMNAIVKEIQYHPTTYQELHIDFQELIDDQYIEVNVPVRCIGIEDCVGVKLGGFLREVSRHVKVRCLPKDMPKEFCLDITKLNIGQSRRVKDLNISEEVRSIKSLEDVVMVIAKR